MTPTSNLDFILIEDFEDKVKWRIKTRQGMQSYGKLIYREPLFPNARTNSQKELHDLFLNDLKFLRESADIQKRAKVVDQKYAYEVKCFFFNPGLDFLDIEPSIERQKEALPGQPRLIALWVYGYNKRHTLHAVFSNSSNHKVSVPMGRLDFFGWERIEVQVPAIIQKRNPKNANRFDFTFHGFRVKSQRNEEPGMFLFTFDAVMILSDKGAEEYPGALIKDKWR